jgi:hypothetical protein
MKIYPEMPKNTRISCPPLQADELWEQRAITHRRSDTTLNNNRTSNGQCFVVLCHPAPARVSAEVNCSYNGCIDQAI